MKVIVLAIVAVFLSGCIKDDTIKPPKQDQLIFQIDPKLLTTPPTIEPL